MFSRCRKKSLGLAVLGLGFPARIARLETRNSQRRSQPPLLRKLTLVKTALLLALLFAVGNAAASERVLQVCADPNNLPFSNQRGEGLKTASPISLAESLAQKLIIPGGRNGAASCAIQWARACAI
jgi:hypothetical protein